MKLTFNNAGHEKNGDRHGYGAEILGRRTGHTHTGNEVLYEMIPI